MPSDCFPVYSTKLMGRDIRRMNNAGYQKLAGCNGIRGFAAVEFTFATIMDAESLALLPKRLGIH